jgi:hypothetical protein
MRKTQQTVVLMRKPTADVAALRSPDGAGLNPTGTVQPTWFGRLPGLVSRLLSRMGLCGEGRSCRGLTNVTVTRVERTLVVKTTALCPRCGAELTGKETHPALDRGKPVKPAREAKERK